LDLGTHALRRAREERRNASSLALLSRKTLVTMRIN
jgi:hypothetical protein